MTIEHRVITGDGLHPPKGANNVGELVFVGTTAADYRVEVASIERNMFAYNATTRLAAYGDVNVTSFFAFRGASGSYTAFEALPARFEDVASDPTNATGVTFLYAKQASGTSELFARNEAGQIIQLTGPSGVFVSLDDAYNNGRTITADAGPVEIDASSVSPAEALLVRDTVYGLDASATDTEGSQLIIRPGNGTGTAPGGQLKIQGTKAGGSSGSSENTPFDVITVDPGHAIFPCIRYNSNDVTGEFQFHEDAQTVTTGGGGQVSIIELELANNPTAQWVLEAQLTGTDAGGEQAAYKRWACGETDGSSNVTVNATSLSEIFEQFAASIVSKNIDASGTLLRLRFETSNNRTVNWKLRVNLIIGSQ